VNAVRHQACCL